MSRKRKATRIVKSAAPEGTETANEVVPDQLEALARAGAREMLMTALGDEVDAYLGRGRYERGDGFRGYRNGSSPTRLTLGSGTVPLQTPRERGGGFTICPGTRTNPGLNVQQNTKPIQLDRFREYQLQWMQKSGAGRPAQADGATEKRKAEKVARCDFITAALRPRRIRRAAQADEESQGWAAAKNWFHDGTSFDARRPWRHEEAIASLAASRNPPAGRLSPRRVEGLDIEGSRQ